MTWFQTNYITETASRMWKMCRVSEFVNVRASNFWLVEISILTCSKLIKTKCICMHYFTVNAAFSAEEMMTITGFGELAPSTSISGFLPFGLFKTPHWAMTPWIYHVCSGWF